MSSSLPYTEVVHPVINPIPEIISCEAECSCLLFCAVCNDVLHPLNIVLVLWGIQDQTRRKPSFHRRNLQKTDNAPVKPHVLHHPACCLLPPRRPSQPDWLCFLFDSTPGFDPKLGSHLKDKRRPLRAEPLIKIEVFPWILTKLFQCSPYRWTVCERQRQFAPPQIYPKLQLGFLTRIQSQ